MNIDSQRAVLIVDLSLRYGGADVRVLQLAQALHGQRRYAVATIAGSQLQEHLLRQRLNAITVPYHRGDPRILPFLAQTISRGGFKVVDAHNSQSQFWGHMAATLSRGVIRCTTVHSACRMEFSNSLKGKAYEEVLRLTSSFSDQIIAVSDSVREYLHSIGVAAQKITVIPNAVNIPAAFERKRDQDLLLALGCAPSDFIVSVVARLETVKGHDVLLRSLRQAVQKHPDLRCLIVGDGRLRHDLEHQTRTMGLQNHVRFLGFRADVSEILKLSDLLCLPSRSEGLPFALLEACAHRVPLLLTSVGGMARVFSHKKTAYLVPPADERALSEGLIWFVENHGAAAIMTESAFRMMQARFSIDAMISNTLKIYDQQCAETPQGARASLPLPRH